MNKTGPVRGCEAREKDPLPEIDSGRGVLPPPTNHRSRPEFRDQVSKTLMDYWANNEKRRLAQSLKMAKLYEDPNARKALSNAKKGKSIDYVRRSYVIDGVHYDSIKDYSQKTGVTLHVGSKICKSIRKKENNAKD